VRSRVRQDRDLGYHSLQQRGKKQEARQLLAEIYGWFTEGFATRHLKDAKALLDELG